MQRRPKLLPWILSCMALGVSLGATAQTQPAAPPAPPLAVTPTVPGAMVPALPQAVLMPQSAVPPAAVASPAAAAPSAPASAPIPAPVVAAPASTPASAPPPPPPKRVDVSWLDEPLGPDPAAWRYSAALDLFGATVQADPLRRVLLQRYVAQLRGETPDATLTVRKAILQGERATPPDADNEMRVRWAEQVNQHLRITMPGQTTVKIPPELEADSARLREAAPGLWSLHAADGTVRSRIWWVKLRNSAKLALALAEFRVRAPAGNEQTQFECTLPRYEESALALPGQDTAYICRATAGAGSPKAFEDLARALRTQATMPVRLEPLDLQGSTPASRVMLRLEGPQRAAAEALVALADQQAMSSPRAGGGKHAAATPASAAANAATGGGKLRWAAVALVALALFSLMNVMAGRRAAVTTSWVLLTLAAAMMAFKGVPAAWSLAPRAGANDGSIWQAVLFTALVPGLVTLALAVVHEVLFGERIGLLRGVAATVAEVVVDPVVDRLFSGRR